MGLHYYIGNALEPIKKPALIIHVCNDIGAWGSGFVIAVSNVSPKPELLYLNWKESCKDGYLPLGKTQSIQIDDDVYIINMIAQHDVRVINGIPPIRMEALKECLNTVNNLAIIKGATIHAPRIGAVRSGGNWHDIEKLMKETLTVDTYIYTLEIEKNMWDTEYENA